MRAHVCANVSGRSSAGPMAGCPLGVAAMLRRLASSELCLLREARLLPIGGNCTPLSMISACTSLRASALLGRPICTLSCATGGADIPFRLGDSMSGDMLTCSDAGRRVGDDVSGVMTPDTRIRLSEGVSARLDSFRSSGASPSAWLSPLSCSTSVLRADLSARCRELPLKGGSPGTTGAPGARSGAAAGDMSGPGAAGIAASVERLSPTRLPPAEKMCRKDSGTLWREPM